jgi:hypothetical protein
MAPWMPKVTHHLPPSHSSFVRRFGIEIGRALRNKREGIGGTVTEAEIRDLAVGRHLKGRSFASSCWTASWNRPQSRLSTMINLTELVFGS